MKVVLLAGGFGTRLRPLTANIPKPMVPLIGIPIIHHVVKHLKKHGFTEIICVLFHQPDIIKDYLKDGSEFGVKIRYVIPEKDFGTAGAVKQARQYLSGDFLVMSADVITDFDLGRIVEFHKSKRALATIALAHVSDPLEYGIVILRKNKTVEKFLEKPTWAEVFSDTVNTGIYVLNSKILNQIPADKSYDFSLELFPKMLVSKKGSLFGFPAKGYWRDIGSLAEYVKVHQDYLAGNIALYSKIQKLGMNIIVSSTATISENSFLGDGVIIGDNARITSSVIGKNCQIGRDTIIDNSVIWDNVEIGAESRLEHNIIGSNVIIKERNIVQNGAVIGDGSIVESDSIIKPYIKIWPDKSIEEGSIVSSSIIWRKTWSKGVFGAYGVTGIGNVEITPEFAASLGAAYGSMIESGGYVAASRDSHKTSRIIYRALMSGILSTGVNISDLEMVPIPVARYELKALRSKGGFHVRKSPYDPEIIDIRFFDSDGMDIPPSKEKNIERLFFREDFKRPCVDGTGELQFPFYRVAKQYRDGLLSSVDKNSISCSAFKMVIDYAYGSASNIFPSILGELGCEAIAIDAHIDETKITKTREQFERSLTQLSQIVTSLKADFGLMLDTGAEKIFLADESGRILSGEETLALMTYLVCHVEKPKIIATPVTSSFVVEKIAKKFGTKVLRTRTSLRYMMEATGSQDVNFLGESWGGFIFPKFQPAFDGMFAATKLLELISKEKKNFVEIIESIPRTNILKVEFNCPTEKKGILMRNLIELKHDGRVQLIDGIKINFDDSWVLVMLDPVRPIAQLYAEAYLKKDSENLIRVYSEKINSILRK